MKILNIWDLHYKDFLVEIDGTDEEVKNFKDLLADKFKDKSFLMIRTTERGLK